MLISLKFISSLIKEVPVPPHVIDLASNIESGEDLPEDAYWQLELLINEWSSLKARVRTQAVTDAVEIFAAARAIETRLMAWAALSPRIDASFSYRQVYTDSDQPHIFQREYRVFVDLDRARQWTMFGIMRLLIGSLQTQAIVPRTDAFPGGEQLRMALSLLDSMDDFCATIPHCLNHVTAYTPVAKPTAPIW